LRVEPAPSRAAALNVALVIDHSGSMGERCVGRSGRLSKHDAVRSGLYKLAEQLGPADRIDLWEFDNLVRHIGSSGGSSRAGSEAGSDALALLQQLSGPDGGTEIGNALREVIAQSAAQDVLIITDGKSHALDVHKLAEAEGLVTHLTSLVLVDEEGTRQEGIPVTRKVPLPSPRTASYASAPAAMAAHYAGPGVARMCPFPLQDVDLDAEFLKRIFEPHVEKPRSEKGSLAKIALQIDWTRYARQLQTGDLARRLAKRVRAAAAHPEVVLLASRLGLEPIRRAIALIACALPVTSPRHCAWPERSLVDRRPGRPTT
jgi:hypothetical protein